MQVGQAFVAQWNAMKTGDNSRNTDAAVAVERQIQELFNFQHFQINAVEDRSSLQIIIDNWSYKIDEVGSGLAQFIISLAHAAMKRPRYVLIDRTGVKPACINAVKFCYLLGELCYRRSLICVS